MFYLLQATNQNLILGFLPEYLGLLIFGAVLIGVTIALRWVFHKSDSGSDVKIDKNTKTARS